MGGLANFGLKILSFAGHLKNVVIGAAGLAGGAALVDTTAGTGITQNILSKVYGVAGKAERDAGLETSYFGISKFADMFAKFVESIFGQSKFTQGIRNWANENMGTTQDSTSTLGPQSNGKTVDIVNTPTQVAELSAMDKTGDNLGLGAGALAGGTALALGAGVKAIPVLASVAAATDGVWDTAGYALKGEWQKAGVRLASGAAETVLSAGGFLSMAFAQVAREGVETLGERALGSNAHLPDSTIVSMTKQYVFGMK